MTLQKESEPNPPRRHPLKSAAIAIAGVLAAVYLLNPSLGIFELIPDNLPVVGNLDEGGAMVLLLYCLRYFGFIRAGSTVPDQSARDSAG